MLYKGQIWPRATLCGSIVVLISKKDGTLRMYMYCRLLNIITIKKWYLLSCINEIIDQLFGDENFSKNNLKYGYSHIRSKPNVEENVQMLRIVSMVSDVVWYYISCDFHVNDEKSVRMYVNIFLIVYLDGVLDFIKTWEENLQHMHRLFTTLQIEKLHVNIKKCTLGQTKLVYLGFHVNRDGLKIFIQWRFQPFYMGYHWRAFMPWNVSWV